MAQLVLIRHGQSTWNAENLFTGWRDPDLTEKGEAEARHAGAMLKAKGIKFDHAFTSALKRAQATCQLLLATQGQTGLETMADAALNERDYGALSGLNKDEAREKWGAEQVQIWRRSYDDPPPQGESLKDTAARVLPFFADHIRPQLAQGKNILVAAHGNSLRALVMELDGLDAQSILDVEISTGEPIIYQLNDAGEITGKEILPKN